MKVMLLSLPGYQENDGNLFPLGIGYLAGALKQSHEVNAYHFHKIQYAWEEIPGRVDLLKPDIVGLTCSTFNRGNVREMIKFLKTIDNKITIVVGGVHATFCYEQMLTKYGADVVVMGEGEKTIKELCNAIENNLPLDSIKGIAYKEKNNIIVTPPSDPVQNLDDLPIPDYSYAVPYIERSKIGFIITSRGCPVRCTFCSTSSYWGQKVRMYSVKRVVDEMEMIISRYKVKKIFFHDDTFNLGIERVKAICKEIMDRKIKVEWGCSCRVTPVSEEMISCMVEAGCRHICWGIESGSEEMLKKIEKKISLQQIRNAFELSRKFNTVMSTGAFAMVGNPGETGNTINDTVKFLNSIPMTDLPSASILYVLPGTLIYKDLKNKGYIKDEDWYKYDTVPSYTIENSYLTLVKWAKQVRNSALRIPFDPQIHFWYGAMDTSDINDDSKIDIITKKIGTIITKPQLLVEYFGKLLPAGKIRF